MKLKPYCIKCGCGNGYFRGLYDPYVLALLTLEHPLHTKK